MSSLFRSTYFKMSFSARVALTCFFLSAVPAFAGHVFEGVDLRSGKETSLIREDASSKATVVIFLSSKCPCSMSHAAEVNKLSTDFPDFRFIGINSNRDEDLDAAQKYFSAQSFSFPILRDEKAALANELKALKTPHAFILLKDGTKLFQGGISNSATFSRANRQYLREALEDLKAGRELRTPLARALGCVITR